VNRGAPHRRCAPRCAARNIRAERSPPAQVIRAGDKTVVGRRSKGIDTPGTFPVLGVVRMVSYLEQPAGRRREMSEGLKK